MKGMNPNLAVVNQVQKFIGTSYDVVKKVADNLETITGLYDEIADLNNRWQGNLDTAPVLRPDGTPLEEGDRYYDKKLFGTFVYSNGSWLNQNAVVTSVETTIIDASNRVNGNTVVTLDGTYDPNSGTIMVYVNQAYQIPKNSNQTIGSYTESSSNSITFPGTSLPDDTIVVVIYGLPISTVNPIIAVNQGVYFAETEGQTLIPLPEGISYTPNTSNLEVHLDGKLLYSGLDYQETSPDYIQTTAPATKGATFVFKQGSLLGNSGDQSSVFVALPSAAAIPLNAKVLTSDNVIVTKGGNTLGDGSGGVFVFDATVGKYTANGVTIVDASVPSLNQGTGIGNGCWVRQYEGRIKSEWFNSPFRGMATLRLVKAVDGDLIDVLGFFEDTNTGGGLFKWVANMQASEHNGGTIISPLVISAPASPAWYIAPTTGEGCWVRQEQGNLSVDWFGAKEGVDSTEAFVAAALIGNPEVPTKTYEINDAVTGSFYSFGAVSITGTGSVTSIKNLLV